MKAGMMEPRWLDDGDAAGDAKMAASSRSPILIGVDGYDWWIRWYLSSGCAGWYRG